MGMGNSTSMIPETTWLANVKLHNRWRGSDYLKCNNIARAELKDHYL